MNLETQLIQALDSALPSFVVGASLVVAAFIAVIAGRRLVRRWQFNEASLQRIRQAWRVVEEHANQADDTHLRMAVIKADAVLDMALRAKMFPGHNTGDRLKFATHKYRGLKRVRWAHGLRNTLAHEPLRAVTPNQTLGAIAAFRAALRELGAL